MMPCLTVSRTFIRRCPSSPSSVSTTRSRTSSTTIEVVVRPSTDCLSGYSMTTSPVCASNGAALIGRPQGVLCGSFGDSTDGSRSASCMDSVASSSVEVVGSSSRLSASTDGSEEDGCASSNGAVSSSNQSCSSASAMVQPTGHTLDEGGCQ